MKEPPLGPVKRQPFRDIVYDRLMELIVSGQLVPFEVIREDEVAEWLSVSRHPVREAITRLESNGFVDTRLGSSPRVAPNTIRNAALRERLVISLLVVAVETDLSFVTENDVRELEAALKKYRAAEKAADVHACNLALLAFDDLVISSSRTLPLLDAFRDRLAPHLMRAIDDVGDTPLALPPKRGTSYIEPMIEAFKNRDADAAVAVLDVARANMLSWLRANSTRVSASPSEGESKVGPTGIDFNNPFETRRL